MVLVAGSAVAQQTAQPAAPVPTMSLDEVLRTARAANAALKVPAYDMAIGEQRRREALAVNEWKLLGSGDFIYAPGPPFGYDPAITNLGEERAQVIATRPIFDGGLRRAAVAAADAELAGARAGYRIAERDLDLEVRNNYIDAESALREIDAHREGIAQLREYRILLQSRKSSGMPVQPELLRLDLRLQGEQASILQAEARHRQAIEFLNELMGRDPAAPLEVAPLPELVAPSSIPAASLPPSLLQAPPVATPAPAAPPVATPAPAATLTPPTPATLTPADEQNPAIAGLPETAIALSAVQSAEAKVMLIEAERRFTLGFNADAGLWASDTTHLTPPDRRDLGYSLNFDFAIPIRDKTYAPRLAQAKLGIERSRQNLTVAERNAVLQQTQARTALRDIYDEIELLRSMLQSAHDAWLESKSLYLGGSVPFVDVTDAYASWIDSRIQLGDAEARYRQAEALLLRWTVSP